MLTNIICQYLDDNHDELEYKKNLFAEEGRGDKYIVVKETTSNPIDSSLEEHRMSNIQILSNGYQIEESHQLVQEIVDLIDVMPGTTEYTHEFLDINKTETVVIKSVVILNYPLNIQYRNHRICSANLTLRYSYQYG